MAGFAVITAKGPTWDHRRGVREQQAWEEHAAFADDLVGQGIIILGGPIGGSADEIALLAVETADEPALRSIFSRDPWMVNGVFRIKEVRSWTWWLDGRSRWSDQC
jgi:uncharacterized protein YciI